MQAQLEPRPGREFFLCVEFGCNCLRNWHPQGCQGIFFGGKIQAHSMRNWRSLPLGVLAFVREGLVLWRAMQVSGRAEPLSGLAEVWLSPEHVDGVRYLRELADNIAQELGALPFGEVFRRSGRKAQAAALRTLLRSLAASWQLMESEGEFLSGIVITPSLELSISGQRNYPPFGRLLFRFAVISSPTPVGRFPTRWYICPAETSPPAVATPHIPDARPSL